MEILFLAALAFIVWHFLPQRDPNKPSPRYRERATDTDCESPAEDAFLRAIKAIYNLKPLGRSFVGEGLRLDLQVEEGTLPGRFSCKRLVSD